MNILSFSVRILHLGDAVLFRDFTEANIVKLMQWKNRGFGTCCKFQILRSHFSAPRYASILILQALK